MLAEGNEIVVVDQGPDEVSASGLYCRFRQGPPFSQCLATLGNFLSAGSKSQEPLKGLPHKGLITQRFPTHQLSGYLWRCVEDQFAIGKR